LHRSTFHRNPLFIVYRLIEYVLFRVAGPNINDIELLAIDRPVVKAGLSRGATVPAMFLLPIVFVAILQLTPFGKSFINRTF
jgi:hypothetical protein